MNLVKRSTVYLGGLGLVALFCLGFLCHEKSAADEAGARLETTVTELNRLRRSAPFPNEDNLRKTKEQTEKYRASLAALEGEMKSHMFLRLPLQPNEFQAQLRLAVNEVSEHAARGKVQLPVSFNLGFDEYATSLPNLEAAPRLGRQLRAIEWLANTLIDAHVDSLGALKRTPLLEEKSGAASATSPAAANARAPTTSPTVAPETIVDFATIDLSFSGSPTAVRRAVNDISAAKDQFYVLRTLLVKNQNDKGPKRGAPEALATAPPTVSPGANSAAKKDLPISFIVGTEHLDVATRIEILRFNLPEKETR